MTKLPENIIPSIKGGKVFDFTCNFGNPITSYYRLNKNITLLGKNIVLPGDDFYVEIDGDKKRIQINSISALRSAFEELVTASEVFLKRHTPFIWGYPLSYPDFSLLKKDLLVNQLIFDVLFDKYILESKLMTRNAYSTYMSEKLRADTTYSHAINEQLTRGMEPYHDRNAYSNLREQWKLLGIDPDKYAKYYTPLMKENSCKKKPQVVWDQLYFNFCVLVTSRQYRRQLTKEGRNYPYEDITSDLISYNAFVNKLLPQENESVEKYFRMSMNYYLLESYKRVDFMFMLAKALDPSEIDKVHRKHFLVRRFTPFVLVPYIQDNELLFRVDYKYYRPLFMIEKAILDEASEISNPSYRYYESLLGKYQHIHAKAYELFKYHYAFHSSNYAEIKKFLQDCYDMRSYHQSHDFWDLIQNKNWKKIDANDKQKIKEQIRHFLSINDAFFWKSSDRDYTKPDADN